MPVLKGLEWTFDTVATTYEKLRPGYVAELYEVIFNYISINENSNVVEVGSGGGQATAPILKTGCQLTAVEYGEQFSELLREKFKEYPKFSVITGKFEDIEFCENSVDLVFSASAFHWVPENIGYEKVFVEINKETVTVIVSKLDETKNDVAKIINVVFKTVGVNVFVEVMFKN